MALPIISSGRSGAEIFVSMDESPLISPFLAEENETTVVEADLKVNPEPVLLTKNEPKPAPIQEGREKATEATVPPIANKVAPAEVVEKPGTPLVPRAEQSIVSPPRNSAETVAEVPSFILPPPRERSSEQVIAPRPALTTSQSTTTQVVEQKRSEPRQMNTNIEPVEAVPAAHNEKRAASGSFFGFANIAYLAGALAVLGWIAWRIFSRPSGRENRSLITRSMDSRR